MNYRNYQLPTTPVITITPSLNTWLAKKGISEWAAETRRRLLDGTVSAQLAKQRPVDDIIREWREGRAE